jgi:hypothetical protein
MLGVELLLMNSNNVMLCMQTGMRLVAVDATLYCMRRTRPYSRMYVCIAAALGLHITLAIGCKTVCVMAFI